MSVGADTPPVKYSFYRRFRALSVHRRSTASVCAWRLRWHSGMPLAFQLSSTPWGSTSVPYLVSAALPPKYFQHSGAGTRPRIQSVLGGGAAPAPRSSTRLLLPFEHSLVPAPPLDRISTSCTAARGIDTVLVALGHTSSTCSQSARIYSWVSATLSFRTRRCTASVLHTRRRRLTLRSTQYYRPPSLQDPGLDYSCSQVRALILVQSSAQAPPL